MGGGGNGGHCEEKLLRLGHEYNEIGCSCITFSYYGEGATVSQRVIGADCFSFCVCVGMMIGVCGTRFRRHTVCGVVS